MNMSSAEHEALVPRLAQQLVALLRSNDLMESVGVEIEPGKGDHGFDFVAHGRTKRGAELRFVVECKTEPRPVHFPYSNITRQFAPGGGVAVADVPVFGAPFIGPRMAEVCWDHGWGWFDLAGNVRIGVPGLLYIERTGQKPSEPRPRANLSTPEGVLAK